MERVKNLVSKTAREFEQEIEAYQKEIEVLVKLKKQLNILARYYISSQEPKLVLRYRTDSLFLIEAFKCLITAPEEALRMVSGIVLENNSYILDRLVKVDYQASVVAAKANVKDLFTKLIELDEKYGHLLLAVFHSHPFNGIAGTCPSGIDRNLQENLETSGFKTIQAVFARDGHIRFFSNKLNFEVEVYGKGVQKISAKENETIFKINEIKN